MAETEQSALNGEAEGLDLNEILMIRRDKLSALKEEGMDPFGEVRFDVTHHAGEITGNFSEMENKTVSLAGRMMSKRGMARPLSATFRTEAARSSFI